MANINMVTVTTVDGVNVVTDSILTKIKTDFETYKINESEFFVKYVAFEVTAGTTFSINGNTLKVPSTGAFESPYGDHIWLKIKSLIFDDDGLEINIYFIY